ncbi:MAG: hypothetical protein IJF03_01845 [Lachnospiraceae bacterium]|nr:hypothetical protein [Lachnospiraceae bacterium]
MKLRKNVAIVLGLIMIVNSNNVALASGNEAKSTVREATLGNAEIDLSNESENTVKRILKENGLDYCAERDYEKIIICEKTPLEGGKNKYKGQPYRIVYQYYNMPIKEVKKQKFKHWDALNKAFNILIGFRKPYVWVPATILGIDFSKWEAPGPKSYVKTSIYTHVTEKCFQFVTKGHKANDWANYGICRKASIEDTTIAYRLIDKKKNKYTSQVGKKTTIRKTSHYDNNNYMLKKAYEYWKVSQPGYQEYIQ